MISASRNANACHDKYQDASQHNEVVRVPSQSWPARARHACWGRCPCRRKPVTLAALDHIAREYCTSRGGEWPPRLPRRDKYR